METDGLAPERARLLESGLSDAVIETVQAARATSTRSLYTLKWRVFSTWCRDRGCDPLVCPIGEVLAFLQHLFDQGRTPSTLKVYLAAISACHVGYAGVSPGAHPLASRFMKGVRRLRPSSSPSVPTWDLATVLRGLALTPFDPLSSASLKMLSLKTALLLALVSVKRVSDLTALSVSPDCLEFTQGDARVTLRPNPFSRPKVLSTDPRSRVIELAALPETGSSVPVTLCPVRALRAYLTRTQSIRKTNQLFVCHGERAKGQALSTQRMSHWLTEAIRLAYEAAGVPPPAHVRAHSTRGVAASWAFWKGVPMQDICLSASWASGNTFARFYALDVTRPGVAESVLSGPGGGPMDPPTSGSLV